jgi:hypothetical protein
MKRGLKLLFYIGLAGGKRIVETCAPMKRGLKSELLQLAGS